MKRMTARRLGALAIAALLAGVARPCAAFGTPDWAKPHLKAPPPVGGFIAKNDAWVIVYREMELALVGDGFIEQRDRYIYENMTEKEEGFSFQLSFDEGQQELKEMALNVERAYHWQAIKLTRGAVTAADNGGSNLTVTSAEKVAPHNRVVFEYTLTDKLTLIPWCPVQIMRTAPAVEEHFFVEPASAQRGLRLELIVPGDGPPPAGFSPLGESGWKVTAVPAWGRTLSGLVYQPAASSLYPTLIAHAGGPGESFAEFAKNYRKAWDEGCKTVDSPQVRAKSEELAQGATGAGEKARRLGNFVQQAVRYDDSNENGALAWIPIEPGETLRSMKADCKGKVMLMQAMLRAQGIESAPVVLRAEERYFSWGKIPPTTYFNHVILAVHLPADAGPIPATLTEGPVKGWVLFDPVLQTAAFGAPLPGYEGVPALFIGAAADPVFVIRTSDPSEEKVSIVARVSVDQGGTERVDLELTDNGRCGLIRRLARTFSQDDIRKQIRETLSEQVTQGVLVDHRLTRAGDAGGDVMRLALTFDAPKSLQEMATTTVCPNPLALPAMLAGIPNGFRPKTPTREEDRIELAPPWDAKRNTNGRAYRVEVAVFLALPPGRSWTPPATRAENQPWLAYEQKWTEEGGLWKGALRLAVPRGDWPAADRQARLKLLDELFSGLYGPLVLKKS